MISQPAADHGEHPVVVPAYHRTHRDGVPVNEFLVNALHIDHLPSPIAHAEMNIGV
ncbi:MAG: hypothetical protein R6W71_01430 [Bacteroidales bacterium]